MKTKFSFLKWLLTLMISLGAIGAWAQNQDPAQTVCVGSQPYYVDASTIPGASYHWSVSGGGTITSALNNDSITIDWTTTGGPYTVSVYTSANGCDGPVQSLPVTVMPQPIGPTLAAKTPNLASVCVGTDVSATFTAGSGGVGCSDVYQYRFDSGAWLTYTPGSNLSTTGHTLVEIQGQRSGCTSGAGCDGTSWVTLASWNVAPMPAATVSYTGSPFCTSVSTPQAVTLTGTTGGIYSSTAGLTINASTGAITPSTSTAGVYLVSYTIAAAGGCDEVIATTSATITIAPTATIAYAGTPFCSTVATPQAVTLTGTTGGIYSSTAGLVINASTGAITPSTSTAGTYIVTYTIAASGGCAEVTATASVTITTLPAATIAYDNAPFCNDVASLQAVTISGTSGGTYSSTAGLTINSATGAINPSTSTAGDYTVTYTIAAAGGCSAVTATTPVTINVIPTTSSIWHN